MTIPARIGRPRKRAHDQMSDDAGSDGEYRPTHSAPKASPPAPFKQTNQIPVTKAQYDRLHLIQRVPSVYKTESGLPYFSKEWYKEVSKNDGFWKDILAKIPVSTQKKYLVTFVSSAMSQAKSIATAEAQPNSTSKVSRINKPTAVPFDSTRPTVECDVCKRPSENGNGICNVCLAMHDDAKDDEMGVKKGRKATNKLVGIPFGEEDDTIRAEDDDPVKVEESSVQVEDSMKVKSRIQAKTEQHLPMMHTLEDGQKVLEINGKYVLVAASAPVKLET